MSNSEPLTKDQLVKAIEKLEKNPEDKGKILGEAGISILGGALGASAAGTLAYAAGATSIPLLTTAAGWLGMSVAVATPVGWVIGAGVAGAAAAYGISKLISGSGFSEGEKSELLKQYQKMKIDVEAKEQADRITESDKTQFIISIKRLIEGDVLSPKKAQEYIKYVENGRIPISKALAEVDALLKRHEIKK